MLSKYVEIFSSRTVPKREIGQYAGYLLKLREAVRKSNNLFTNTKMCCSAIVLVSLISKYTDALDPQKPSQ